MSDSDGYLRLVCIGPINPVSYDNTEGIEPNENSDNSLILRLKYGDRTFLFAGDAGSAAGKSSGDLKEYIDISEKDWGPSYLNAEVFKNGHHHSIKTQEVVDLIKPTYTVMQARIDESTLPTHLPTNEYIERLRPYTEKIYISDETQDGNIVFTTNGRDNYEINTSLNPTNKVYLTYDGTAMQNRVNLYPGKSHKLYAMITPVDAEVKDVKWEKTGEGLSIKKIIDGGKTCTIEADDSLGQDLNGEEKTVKFSAKVGGSNVNGEVKVNITNVIMRLKRTLSVSGQSIELKANLNGDFYKEGTEVKFEMDDKSKKIVGFEGNTNDNSVTVKAEKDDDSYSAIVNLIGKKTRNSNNKGDYCK